MSHLAWREWQKKLILKRARQLRITPKLSPQVEAELKELYKTEAHS